MMLTRDDDSYCEFCGRDDDGIKTWQRHGFSQRPPHDENPVTMVDEAYAKWAAEHRQPLHVFRTVAAWERAGRMGVLVLDWSSRDLIVRLHLGDHPVIFEDWATVLALARAHEFRNDDLPF